MRSTSCPITPQKWRHDPTSANASKSATNNLTIPNGFLTDVILGWLIVTRPQDKSHDSTFWYTSFWDFCRRYCHERYGVEWCFSSEQSLLLHAESTHIPKQVIVWTPKGSGNNTVLPFDTSLCDLKKDLPPKSDIVTKDGLSILSVEVALINVPEAFYRSYAMEAQIVLRV